MPKHSGSYRIVFWNVKRKNLTDLVCSLAASTEADVVVLNENGTTSEVILKALRDRVSFEFFIPKFISEKRFHCFCRDSLLDVTEVHEGFRTSFRNLSIGSQKLLLAFVHGIDIRNYDGETRQSFAQELASEMNFVIEQQQTKKLIMMGDFNMNPYDKGMNLAAGLNAMMTRTCARVGSRTHLSKSYDFYYNPMWSLFGDNTEGPPGTVYNTSNRGTYGWSMLDQVVLNYSILDLFDKVTILDSAGGVTLKDNNGRPDGKNASDHFPILVSLRGDR